MCKNLNLEGETVDGRCASAQSGRLVSRTLSNQAYEWLQLIRDGDEAPSHISITKRCSFGDLRESHYPDNETGRGIMEMVITWLRMTPGIWKTPLRGSFYLPLPFALSITSVSSVWSLKALSENVSFCCSAYLTRLSAPALCDLRSQ